MTGVAHQPHEHRSDGAETQPGLVVLGHGSRDPRAAEEFATLLDLVRAAAGDQPVRGGFLELADPPIDDAIDALVADGADDVVAVPYVLFGAGHLKDDGPAVLDRARRRHPNVRFRLARDLGVHPAVLEVAEGRARESRHRSGTRAPAATDAIVVIGRGSTDPDACADAVKFVRLLGDGRGLGLVEPAFQAMSSPSLDEALDRCRLLGATHVTVLPLFLFAGVLVERIADRAHAWSAGCHGVGVTVAGHLGADPRLAALVVERQREAREGDVRMNCDLCAYRVRLPGFEDKVGTALSLAPPERSTRGWRARRAANQAAARSTEKRERPRIGLGRRLGAPPSPERDAPAVEVTGLRHVWPDGTVALAGVDLTIANRERVAVLGPNGSGKTTLVLHLVGALDRSAGTVTV
nr:ATP-binding cassette domain-containing protein [Acidimicrobiia bacterium]